MELSNEADRILYIDNSLAVISKNIGEVSESEEHNSGKSVIEVFLKILEEKAGHSLPELEAVHRIDQPVSGCLLLAFDRDTLADLANQFKSGTVRKKYWAITERKNTANQSVDSGKLEHMIRFDTKTRKSYAEEIGTVSGPDWKRASLSWRRIGAGDRYDFIEIELETGRTHQIRAQFAAAGMTIKGDLKYGARRSEILGGIRLHAASIQFRHPVTGNTVTVTAPILNPDPLWQAFMKVSG